MWFTRSILRPRAPVNLWNPMMQFLEMMKPDSVIKWRKYSYFDKCCFKYLQLFRIIWSLNHLLTSLFCRVRPYFVRFIYYDSYSRISNDLSRFSRIIANIFEPFKLSKNFIILSEKMKSSLWFQEHGKLWSQKIGRWNIL